MRDLRLVIFDVDGTLVDSQAEIMAAMEIAYADQALPCPSRSQVLSIVGLSLVEAFTVLSPNAPITGLVDAYKDAFQALRGQGGDDRSPLFSGAREALMALGAQDHTLLAVATGKSRRGLDKMIEKHGLEGVFMSRQTADDHPSKPHPAMVVAALRDAGVAPHRAVMLGDTTFDMDMARAAGVATIGVGWGYHAADTLNADRLIGEFAQLTAAVDDLIGQ